MFERYVIKIHKVDNIFYRLFYVGAALYNIIFVATMIVPGYAAIPNMFFRLFYYFISGGLIVINGALFIEETLGKNAQARIRLMAIYSIFMIVVVGFEIVYVATSGKFFTTGFVWLWVECFTALAIGRRYFSEKITEEALKLYDKDDEK